MRLVRHSLEAGVLGRRSIRGAGPALIAAAIVVLAGCGGSKPSAQPSDAVSGSGAHLSQPISLADCTDWKDGSVQERLGTVRQLRDFAGGAVVGASGKAPAGTGAVLDDEKAYDLIDNYCGNEFARAFKLYKLYERAAAFAGTPAAAP